jgi:hypothetical protein
MTKKVVKKGTRPADLGIAVQQAIYNDDDYDEDELRDLYIRADKLGRAWIDCALICLCGWSLPTLAKHCGRKLPQFYGNQFVVAETSNFREQPCKHGKTYRGRCVACGEQVAPEPKIKRTK